MRTPFLPIFRRKTPDESQHTSHSIASAPQCFVVSFERSKVWSSDILIWRDAAAKNPSNSRAHMGLGDSYMMHGRCADAIREFQTVERDIPISRAMRAPLTTIVAFSASSVNSAARRRSVVPGSVGCGARLAMGREAV